MSDPINLEPSKPLYCQVCRKIKAIVLPDYQGDLSQVKCVNCLIQGAAERSDLPNDWVHLDQIERVAERTIAEMQIVVSRCRDAKNHADTRAASSALPAGEGVPAIAEFMGRPFKWWADVLEVMQNHTVEDAESLGKRLQFRQVQADGLPSTVGLMDILVGELEDQANWHDSEAERLFSSARSGTHRTLASNCRFAIKQALAAIQPKEAA